MSLAPFLDRVHDAAGPLLGGMASSELGQRLEATSVVLEIDEHTAALPGQASGFLLAANLLARLYPRVGIDAPSALTDDALRLVRSINPDITIGPPRGRQLTISWLGGAPDANRVTVACQGWNLRIDGTDGTNSAAEPLAAMAAACLAVGEVFRSLFGPELDHARRDPDPFELNLVTLGDWSDTPPLPGPVELGVVHLAGCGAIGQATAAALRELDVRGELIAVDPERVDLGNIQRYALALLADVGRTKVDIIEKAFAHHPLVVTPVATVWGADARTEPGQRTVLAALDTRQGRVELQASLPREAFNAWTQPEDVGVSRHQAFGEQPCLACLGWPKHERPSDSHLIARRLQESEARVVSYLLQGVPVGSPLEPQQISNTNRLAVSPEEAQRWTEHSLLSDVSERFQLSAGDIAAIATLPITHLYRDVVCAGVLLEKQGEQRDAELSVPLAHQSALAGVLLATWFVIDHVPELRAMRPLQPQARYDVLRGGAQIWPRDRGREPRCLCFDNDFLNAYAQRWPAEDAKSRRHGDS
jgi:ThiF family